MSLLGTVWMYIQPRRVRREQQIQGELLEERVCQDQACPSQPFPLRPARMLICLWVSRQFGHPWTHVALPAQSIPLNQSRFSSEVQTCHCRHSTSLHSLCCFVMFWSCAVYQFSSISNLLEKPSYMAPSS